MISAVPTADFAWRFAHVRIGVPLRRTNHNAAVSEREVRVQDPSILARHKFRFWKPNAAQSHASRAQRRDKEGQEQPTAIH